MQIMPDWFAKYEPSHLRYSNKQFMQTCEHTHQNNSHADGHVDNGLGVHMRSFNVITVYMTDSPTCALGAA